uniref:NADPH-dependent F420 reductase n=1 Tax=Polaromonas sp. TaxID=1869339 RepID=UPI00159A9C6C|nr:NAD(P)-binding domain-containing protein [Polaromonas sp.]QJS06450.1 NADP oxidoreductase [Polaromonas sp.]
MRIGTIGAGEVARSFAAKAITAGHHVELSNSRGPDSLALVIEALGAGVSAVTWEEAATNEVVLLAVPWPAVKASLGRLPAWEGRILIDATNGFGEAGLLDFGDGSSSETVAVLAPGARVVKAVNSSFMTNFAKAPVHGDLRRALFVSGDDWAAKKVVADLFEAMGFAPVDLGSLKAGGRMQGVGATLAGHDFFLPWPAPRFFPGFNGHASEAIA